MSQKIFIFAIALLLSPAAQAAPVASSNATVASVPVDELSLEKKEGRALTLEESIKLGIDGATEVLKAENDLRFNGTRLLQAYGQFLPSLVGSGNYSYNTGTVYYTTAAPTSVTGKNKNAGYTLTADLNLFNGLSDVSNLKSSLLKKDAAELTFARAKQLISLDIAQSFLQVILDNKLVVIAKKNLQASQERERLLQGQADVGSANLSDLFRQQAQTSVDEASLLDSQNKTRQDQIVLLKKLRLTVGPDYHFVEPTLTEEENKEKRMDENALVSRALEYRMDLKAENELADATKWDVHSAFSGYLPKLDLVAGLVSGAHYLDSQTVNGANVVPETQSSLGNQLGRQIDKGIGLNLTWNIFDRFLTSENVSRARQVANDTQLDSEDRKLQVEGDVRQAYGNFRTSLQQLRTSKAGVEAAQKAYEVMDGRYEVGSASFLDLITAQSVLVQAQSNRALALINYQLQDRSLGLAVGDLATE